MASVAARSLIRATAVAADETDLEPLRRRTEQNDRGCWSCPADRHAGFWKAM